MYYYYFFVCNISKSAESFIVVAMAEQAWSAAIVNNSLWWEHRKIQSSPGFNQSLL